MRFCLVFIRLAAFVILSGGATSTTTDNDDTRLLQTSNIETAAVANVLHVMQSSESSKRLLRLNDQADISGHDEERSSLIEKGWKKLRKLIKKVWKYVKKPFKKTAKIIKKPFKSRTKNIHIVYYKSRF
ncbi:RxLR-like protein [Plasmopara halstedii]|uniref:Secreted RxLR effector protein RXLR-C09 n=1 Tax=Plasmopara halstedii TaxID=4781 RepID=RLR09_PLAHL|nr:RxLR-like protein [Plasmopara halstedii]A0A0P1A8B0.1 RecName: Full=Secreted RxLR effector protein RXLR-C09; Flags: Precursor [Plasmopara halstedii]CEG36780.1 RxLR-like protein [Plasmopara halstedii]|eukprot:XP_024573149.1 RxLR-like protein [Plasmopara halstedii]